MGETSIQPARSQGLPRHHHHSCPYLYLKDMVSTLRPWLQIFKFVMNRLSHENVDVNTWHNPQKGDVNAEYATVFLPIERNVSQVKFVFLRLLPVIVRWDGEPKTISANNPEYMYYIHVIYVFYIHVIYVLCNMYIMNPDCWVYIVTRFLTICFCFSCDSLKTAWRIHSMHPTLKHIKQKAKKVSPKQN